VYNKFMAGQHEQSAGIPPAHQKNVEMLNEEEVLPLALAEILKPNETAIMVIDAQDAYFRPDAVLPQLAGAGTTRLEEVAPKIKHFLDESRKLPIAATVFTRMIERPDAMPPNYRYKMEKVDGTPPLVEVDGAGWNYFGGIEPEEGDHQITKVHYNPFTNTNLHELLQQKGAKTLILTGGYGSRCVASTAVVAADVYGYNVVVPNDLIANLDSPDNPNALGGEADEVKAFLQALDAVWGYAPSSQAILNTWKEGK
jgi:nicotinamidase-related amidase